ncbi:hypothetical protein BH11PLA1_BH11PLA1_10830 [soil metagenome]
MSSRTPSRATQTLRWLAAWVVLSTISVTLHAVSWMNAPTTADPSATAAFLKVVGNVLTLPTAPGWIVMTRLTGALDGMSVPFALGAAALGWIPWLLGVWIIVWLRRRALGRAAANAAARAVSSADSGETARVEVAAISQPALAALVAGHPSHPARRRFLVDGALGVGAFAATATYGNATLLAPFALRARPFTIPIADLPPALEGLTLALVADVHFGPRVPAAHVREAVALTLAQNPDIIVLGGDYVHNGPRFTAGAMALLKPLCIPGRSIAILGNHDNYFDGHEVNAEALRASGTLLLENAAALVTPARRVVAFDGASSTAGALALAAVTDLVTQGVDPARSLRGIDARTPRIMLSHNPDVAEDPHFASPLARDGSSTRVDLMLSGHTHGGQVRLPLVGAMIVPSAYGQKYVSGLNQGPYFPVITSNGVGISILPVRVNVPPEIVLVTLARKVTA